MSFIDNKIFIIIKNVSQNLKFILLFQIIQAIIIFILVPASLCVEEPEPEVFLPPRNFNPHPYEAKTNLRDSGPVVFPNNQEDDNEARGRNNIVTIPRQTGHPVDNHPYPKVATKNRYTSRLAGKYHRKVRI